MNKERISRQWKLVKVLLVMILLLAITIGSQRTDIDETTTTYSEIAEYSTIFYNVAGNDSIYYFDSDIYGTHLLTLDGSSGNVTVGKGNLTVTENISGYNVTSTNFFIGNGSKLTGISSGGGGSVGGLYGINIETLAAGKTLTPGTDEIYQNLATGGANRIVTLDTASATLADRFVIHDTDVYNCAMYIQIKQAAAEIERLYPQGYKEFIFDGTNWIPANTETQATGTERTLFSMGYKANAYLCGMAIGAEAYGASYGTAIGFQAIAQGSGIAIGYGTISQIYGVAVGRQALASSYGIAMGYKSDAVDRGLALGYWADSGQKYYSQALGYRSKCTRYGETSINIDGDSSQTNNAVMGRWSRTLGPTQVVELRSGGVSNQRFTIRPSSALTFKIMVTARDNTAGDCAAYMFDGLIKRDGAGNTIMSVCNKIVTHEDDATWDCSVTADDTNEALIITATGDAANITQWAARLDGVETHF